MTYLISTPDFTFQFRLEDPMYGLLFFLLGFACGNLFQILLSERSPHDGRDSPNSSDCPRDRVVREEPEQDLTQKGV